MSLSNDFEFQETMLLNKDASPITILAGKPSRIPINSVLGVQPGAVNHLLHLSSSLSCFVRNGTSGAVLSGDKSCHGWKREPHVFLLQEMLLEPPSFGRPPDVSQEGNREDEGGTQGVHGEAAPDEGRGWS